MLFAEWNEFWRKLTYQLLNFQRHYLSIMWIILRDVRKSFTGTWLCLAETGCTSARSVTARRKLVGAQRPIWPSIFSFGRTNASSVWHLSLLKQPPPLIRFWSHQPLFPWRWNWRPYDREHLTKTRHYSDTACMKAQQSNNCSCSPRYCFQREAIPKRITLKVTITDATFGRKVGWFGAVLVTVTAAGF